MEYFFGIIILLGALVFFHELGHFLVAKYFGVRVEVFSLGFGPKILKKKKGETEYCLSLIPLGGYVKLYGEDPNEPVKHDIKRSFSHQPVSKRIAIAAAGPFFNILFAFFIYALIDVGGLEKKTVSMVRQVSRNSHAWHAGLRFGDQIVRVNGKKVVGWEEDVLGEISKYPLQPVKIVYVRGQETHEFSMVPEGQDGWDLFCEKKKVGDLGGVSVRGARASIGITDLNSWGAKTGFKAGDKIVSLNGVKIDYWEELKEYLFHVISGQKLLFKIKRGEEIRDIELKLPPEYFLMTTEQRERFLGFHSYEFFIREPLSADTPAYAAGLKPGDRLVSVDDEPIESWEEFREKIQQYGITPGYINLTYDRGGELSTVKVVPKKMPFPHPCEERREKFHIGIVSDIDDVYVPPQMKSHYELNPFKVVYTSVSKSCFMMYLVGKSIVKMIQGKVSVKSMGGPILIGKVAGDQLKQGFLPFLSLLAAISINLAILNFLPIPVLDGGHLLFFFYEAIVGRRPREKALELANRVGLMIILGLVVLAFYNDLSRYWSGISLFFKKIFGLG